MALPERRCGLLWLSISWKIDHGSRRLEAMLEDSKGGCRGFLEIVMTVGFSVLCVCKPCYMDCVCSQYLTFWVSNVR